MNTTYSNIIYSLYFDKIIFTDYYKHFNVSETTYYNFYLDTSTFLRKSSPR